MKKALMLASVASMIEQFNMKNIELLKNIGYEVDVITNFEHGSTMPQEKVDALKECLKSDGVEPIHVPIPRRIFDISGIINSYRLVKKECEEKEYKLLHCQSPIGGVIARLAVRKMRKKVGAKVIYTAHGFHFCKGAPLKNWLIFFPIEWFCSFFTDTLITINKEDYAFAQKYMHAKQVRYVPGVGIDTEKIHNTLFDRESKRKELGVQDDETVILSVGELNDNKNHETVIRALSKLKDKNIAYIICGRGNKEHYLKELSDELGVNLILSGYRSDIIEVYKSCDIFVFPSKREGLSVALMEAMASGLPLVCSCIRGNTDLVKDSENGFLCKATDVDEFAERIENLLINEDLRFEMGLKSKDVIKDFDLKKVSEKMCTVYGLTENKDVMKHNTYEGDRNESTPFVAK